MSVWVRALNGAVIEVPDHNAAEYVEQGHTVHATEDEARGKVTTKPRTTKAQALTPA